MFSQRLEALSHELLELYRARGLTLATAESCTGGLLSACITEIPGSSDVFNRGFVTYANEAKTEMLGVPEDMLAEHGAVSEQVARAMAEGALASAGVDIALSITGIAGPGGATDTKPLGLVYMGVASKKTGKTEHHKLMFSGDRAHVRAEAVETALEILAEAARETDEEQ